jgi:hypothetical protein
MLDMGFKNIERMKGIACKRAKLNVLCNILKRY